ncbi:ABC transporter permease [Corynebacterium liangguodongii]|uniref:ABC transporter permease n=1 Tax=Corynebacterium liangguodongii TaxID=2079535 RepID=A0A2S0WGR3_9CORY|nr:ABC transporter permease [Corynebacterium liangguodongii]AWB84916.1 ABC transporter permease [Corynebacterium liangguodongii]PWB99376.1 ABC transporter permease [Corynebacterium liangguodongii]
MTAVISPPPTRTRRTVRVPARLISPIAVLLAWQLGSMSGLISPQILPPPSDVATAGWEVLTNGELATSLAVSGRRVVAGFFLGALLGISLGFLTGTSRVADTVLDPLLQAVRAVPHLGLVPLFIIWFGIGELPKVLLIALGVVFPLYLNTASGFRQVDPKLLEAGAVMGFTLPQRLRYIVFPSAAPQLFVGLRQANASAWLSLIVAEQVNARQGLGFLINNARDFYRTDLVIFGLIVYAALGLISEALIRAWESHTFRYRPDTLTR